MKKAIHSLTGIFVLLPTVAAAATSAQSQLLKLEHTWLVAAQQHNVSVLKRLLSDNYVDINYKGVVRHKTDALRASNVQPKNYRQTLGDEKVRLFGDTAVVTGRGVLTDPKDDHPVAAWRFTDVFVKHGGEWQAVSSQETVEQRR